MLKANLESRKSALKKRKHDNEKKDSSFLDTPVTDPNSNGDSYGIQFSKGKIRAIQKIPHSKKENFAIFISLYKCHNYKK